MNATRPRALVVYESMFGNTARIAGAVADGLRLDDVETDLLEVRDAPATVPAEVDLLVVGGPTHGFSMSRRSTRADAVRQGAPPDREDVGIREWLADVVLDPQRLPALATFDTRVAKVRWVPQAAGPSAGRAGHRRELESIARPIGFLVDDVSGPLGAVEPERAVAWGRSLGAAVRQRLATRAAGHR